MVSRQTIIILLYIVNKISVYIHFLNYIGNYKNYNYTKLNCIELILLKLFQNILSLQVGKTL